MRLVFNIFPDYVSSNIISNTSDKIAVIPQFSRPKLFPDFGVFLKYLSCRYAFHYLHNVRGGIPRWRFQEYVYMVFYYFHCIYRKAIFLCYMVEHFFQIARNVTIQYVLSILRYPYQVILQIEYGMFGSSYSHAIFIPSSELFGKRFLNQSLAHFHPASKLMGNQWNFL